METYFCTGCDFKSTDKAEADNHACAWRESSRSPGCSIADLENVRDLILRDVCEAEPDDPDHEQTICINYDYLRLIVDRNLGLTSD